MWHLVYSWQARPRKFEKGCPQQGFHGCEGYGCGINLPVFFWILLGPQKSKYVIEVLEKVDSELLKRPSKHS